MKWLGCKKYGLSSCCFMNSAQLTVRDSNSSLCGSSSCGVSPNYFCLAKTWTRSWMLVFKRKMFPPVQSRSAWCISGHYRNLALIGLFSFSATIASFFESNSWKYMPVVFHTWSAFAWNWRQTCITSWSPFQPSHLQPVLWHCWQYLLKNPWFLPVINTKPSSAPIL